MADNRPIWFASFTLVVLCLGLIIGFRVGTHWPARSLEDPGFVGGRGGPGRGGPGRGGPGRGGPPPLFGRGPGGGPPLPGEIVSRLTSELDLDLTQQEEVKKVLADRRDRLDAVHRDARERFDREQRDLHAAIRLVLKPDQQVKFDRFLDGRRPR